MIAVLNCCVAHPDCGGAGKSTPTDVPHPIEKGYAFVVVYAVRDDWRQLLRGQTPHQATEG